MAEQNLSDTEFKSKRKFGRNIFISFFIILFLFVGIGIGLALYIVNALQPVKAADQSVQFTIPKGVSTSQIAGILQQNGMIKNAVIFRYYVKYKQQGSQMQAGTYTMKPGLSLDEIIQKLKQGETVKPPMLHFTIPEGYTVVQVADKLSSEGTINRKAFLELLNEPDVFSSSWIKQIPNTSKIKYKLEGYLFPDTYELDKKSKEKDIIQAMIADLNEKIAKLPAGWQDQLQKDGLDFHQMMTIASLIEKEVVVDEERPIVAGVIMNRLHIGQPLQVDATIQYSLDKPKDRLYEQDLQIKSPYNTYLNKGLPPGPIANPGIKSIMAAIYPQKNNYLYYVTKKDGSFTHLFAATYAEHLHNIAESKKTAKEVNQTNP